MKKQQHIGIDYGKPIPPLKGTGGCTLFKMTIVGIYLLFCHPDRSEGSIIEEELRVRNEELGVRNE